MSASEPRVRVHLALSDDELRRPLWTFPVADRNAALSARTRRAYSVWKQAADEGSVFRPGAAWERTTDVAPTE